ncbi:GntR family transcriptional regulator [Tissierella pigra]|uniref:GntR family transcriptional regulator n=1 Tax=Tissierella pigra TaxID=2607614 RepID=A0A6N7Y329_9FIRM|nr:GntR family transcriptional regulator [Tissierella pigra]MBU5427505.1 GntR family transcriptional regulator [Tissierella pigra]MSU03195.1 GntR family transcriptional regulator [Tissierella pigra]
MIFNDNLPIYSQIMNLIRKKIVSGELKGGDKLTSVRETSTELKVNPNTIQRAYQELEREGLVFTQRGMGTFVTEDMKIIKDLKNNMASNIIKSFLADMESLGFTSKDIIELINERVKEVK